MGEQGACPDGERGVTAGGVAAVGVPDDEPGSDGVPETHPVTWKAGAVNDGIGGCVFDGP